MSVHLKKKRIHLATEDPDLARRVRQVLSSEGATVFLAETPQKAVMYAMSRPADLFMLDERMPSWEGKDLLAAIRMAAPKIALMIFAQYEHGSCTIDASARGADAVLSYQSDAHQILNAVCHAMGIPCERQPGAGPFHGGAGMHFFHQVNDLTISDFPLPCLPSREGRGE